MKSSWKLGLIFYLILTSIACLSISDEKEIATDVTIELKQLENDIISPIKENTKIKKLSKAERAEQISRMLLERKIPEDQNSSSYESGYLLDEFEKAKKNNSNYRRSSNGVIFTERGPNHVGGRTRSMIIDERDPTGNTWIAGAVSGGVWKTTDGGNSWENLTPDIPNLSVSAIGASESNFDIIYAGTGEPFCNAIFIDGVGVYKSIDGGMNWNQIIDMEAMPDFVNVSRIIVHPNDPNTVLVAASSSRRTFGGDISTSIYKSTNGGTTWTRVFSHDNSVLEDLDFNHFDPNVIYAGLRSEGIVKSSDGGDSWELIREGLPLSFGRVEIASSPLDENRVWASIVGASTARLFFSDDQGESWKEASVLVNGQPFDFLAQGCYDNVITTHPFDNDQVYVGGVNLYNFKLAQGDSALSFEVLEEGTDEFIDFINFTATNPGGGFDYGGGIVPDSLPRIELRFGQGSQLAHRFTVGDRGSGVPPEDYVYEDYVTVPFQAWDVTNNRQLMLSFRDQANNGVFDLIPQDLASAPVDQSREYLYIHLTDYAEQPNGNIGVNGGVEFEQAYFVSMASATESEVDLNAVQSSSLVMDHILRENKETEINVLLDGSGDFNNINRFNVGTNVGLHVDNHFIHTDITNEDNQEFRLIIGNDGGVFVSDDSDNPGTANGDFRLAGFGYRTSQFYGADKAPGQDLYIGGTQDNGTWISRSTGSDLTFNRYFGGDGFEALWNNQSPDLVIASAQFNFFTISRNGSRAQSFGIRGLSDFDEAWGAPFYSRLSNSKKIPNRVYSIGESGIWKTSNFYFNWELCQPDGDWSYRGSSTSIEVSEADPKVVIAGGALSNSSYLQISQDGGNSFTRSGTYREVTLGRISGLALHPTDRETMYTLFSFANRPKVLRSTDLGQTWDDISGFDGNSSESTRGFPNVGVQSLFVFPNNTNRIWVGTEIGIVESLDNGESWSILDSELGSAPVWEMKLQDDQIVIATYGRGIWTATIENYAPNEELFPLISGVIANVDTTFFGLNIPTEFESLALVINGERINLGISGPASGLLPLPNTRLRAFPDRNNSVQLVGIRNGERIESIIETFDILRLEAPVAAYHNNFDAPNDGLDFFGAGFEVRSDQNFNSAGVHTLHNYPFDIDLNYMLRFPIIVEDQVVSYEDVALIEPGAVGSVFGDSNFEDYVVMEASKINSNDWIPLMGGYDASFNDSWLTAYSNGLSGNQNLSAHHSADLRDFFNVGDIILIRFRLSADVGESGWGWFIDNFNIESITTDVEDIEESELLVYPNPVIDELSIQTPQDLERISIFDITGKQLFVRDYDRNQDVERIDMSSYATGTYLVRIKTIESEEVRKIIVQ